MPYPVLLGAVLLLLGSCSTDTTPAQPACTGSVCPGDSGANGSEPPGERDGGVSGPGDAASASRDGGTGPGQQAGSDASMGEDTFSDADPGSVLSEPNDEAVYVFDQTALRSYNLVIAPADLAKLDQDPAAEEYVPATLELEGKSYGPLGVRYKGSVGAFLYPCTAARIPGQTPGAKVGKCSIKIDFNHVDDAARFYGLKQINFHSMGQDPSQLRDRLGYAMFREMGVAAPRAVHAQLSINGKLEGLFALVEQVDGRFTRGRFSEGGKGNLYKEVWPLYTSAASYQAALETNEEVGAVDKMLRFEAAIARGASAAERWLDRDYMLRYLAVDRVIINDDGALHWYCIGGSGTFSDVPPIFNHNFYWYEAEDADRMWLLPWDLDSSFAQSNFVHISPAWNAQAACGCSGSPAQRPSSCDPLTAGWAGWGADFEAAVAKFVSGPFAEASVNAKLDAWSAQIDAATQAASGLHGAPLHFIWNNATNSLRTTIHEARVNHGYSY